MCENEKKHFLPIKRSDFFFLIEVKWALENIIRGVRPPSSPTGKSIIFPHQKLRQDYYERKFVKYITQLDDDDN